MQILLSRWLLTGVALRRGRCTGGVRDMLRRIDADMHAWSTPRLTSQAEAAMAMRTTSCVLISFEDWSAHYIWMTTFC